jgi:hypothetical protein
MDREATPHEAQLDRITTPDKHYRDALGGSLGRKNGKLRTAGADSAYGSVLPICDIADLIANLKAAKALGLTVPLSLLGGAER